MNSYFLAVLTAAAGVALTWVTWPFFSPTPFAPVFAAVAISTHWGHWRAGMVAMITAALGAVLLFPTTGPQAWRPMTLVAFAVVSIVGCALIAGRNRATAALRASESELRRTIEELRASEEAVRQAHKIEAIGHLAAGVAHNFNNLLTVTVGYAEVLEDPSSSDEMRRMAMAEIRTATDRGASLSHQLLTFSRRHSARAVRVPVDETVLGLRDKFARIMREDTHVEISCHTGAAVVIDPRDLQQMLLNLVMNARDALPFGGRIYVEGAVETVAAAPGHPAIEPGTYVRLRVRDNGVGMSPETQAHLFEPFFTTKEVGEGTGLGLPFVHGVAQHAGGFVVVQTEANAGTTVSVYLPPAPAAPHAGADAARPARVSGQPQRRAATILLVEDEEPVRRLTERLLSKAGYQVLSAATPSEARWLFDGHGDQLALLVSDVLMPEMQGPDLANLLLRTRPDLPVLFLSGYSEAIPAEATSTPNVAFLAKPFSTTALIAAIEGLLTAADHRRC